MVKRIVAIAFIFICTSIAWAILSATVLIRTETQNSKLRDKVGKLWGTPHTQKAPSVRQKSTGSEDTNRIPLKSSDISAKLSLDYRKKGLLWYSTYQVEFTGKYVVGNELSESANFDFCFFLPASGAIYDNFTFVINGQEIQNIDFNDGMIVKTLRIEPGQSQEIVLSYASQGLDTWHYNFGDAVSQINNFSLTLTTDFDGIDFPDNTMAPAQKERAGAGWKLNWKYDKLLTDVNIGLAMPERLNPGPWVTQVTAAAPVSLFLFFFFLFVVTTIKKVKIHPMNYFFIGAAFFSFHLLLTYLVDHISIHLAFGISSAVSVFLVISYMRLVVGLKFAFVEIALSQMVYLVFFSYTFFFKGFTGLVITILCICTLFIVMQFTGRVDWEKLFEKTPPKQL